MTRHTVWWFQIKLNKKNMIFFYLRFYYQRMFSLRGLFYYTYWSLCKCCMDFWQVDNAALNLCHGLTVHMHKENLLLCLLSSRIMVIRIDTNPAAVNLTASSTFSSMAVDPIRSSESLSQMSMCMVWRARYRRNQRFSPGLRKLSSTLNCNCRPGDAVQRMRGGLITKNNKRMSRSCDC